MTAPKKQKLPTLTTPRGVASFVYLLKPDTEGQYADNKYKITIGMDKANPKVAELVEKLNALHEEARGKKKTESPVKDGDVVYEEADEDKKEKNEWKRGKYILTFKTQFSPEVMDAAGKPLEGGTEVRGGDIVRVAFAARPYVSGKNAGISLSLRAVRLMAKRSGSGSYASAFDDDDDDDDGYQDDDHEGGHDAGRSGNDGGDGDEDVDF